MKRTIIILFAIFVVAICIFCYIKINKSILVNKEPVDRSDVIVVISPVKDSPVSSPLSISGRARGSWFFEGSFPIVLLDSDRNTIAEGHATAQSEWETNDFVKFLGNLQFNNYIKGQKGILVLKKDNPSGLTANDDSIEIPVLFK